MMRVDQVNNQASNVGTNGADQDISSQFDQAAMNNFDAFSASFEQNGAGSSAEGSTDPDAQSSLQQMNDIISDAAQETGALEDGIIDDNETRAMRDLIQEKYGAEWAQMQQTMQNGFDTGDGVNDFNESVMEGLQYLGLDPNADGAPALEDMTAGLNTAFFGNPEGAMPMDESFGTSDFIDDPMAGMMDPSSSMPEAGPEPTATPGEAGAEGAPTGDAGSPSASSQAQKGGAGSPQASSEGAGPVAGSEPSGGAMPTEGMSGEQPLSVEEFLALMQKLMNGEKLNEEEMAQLASGLSEFTDENGEFDSEGFETALTEAGMDPEQAEGLTETATAFADEIQEAGGSLKDATPEMMAQLGPEIQDAVGGIADNPQMASVMSDFNPMNAVEDDEQSIFDFAQAAMPPVSSSDTNDLFSLVA